MTSSVLDADAGNEKGEEAAPSSQRQEPQGAVSEADEKSEREQPMMETEPSLQLLPDSTPGGEELDLSSAEVDTVASITRDEPEQAKAQEGGAKAGKQAERKPKEGDTAQTDAAAAQAEEGIAKRKTESQKPSQDTHQTDETSTRQPNTETLPEHSSHHSEAHTSIAATRAEQLETHADTKSEAAPKGDRSHAEEQPKQASKVEQDHVEAQPKEAPTSEKSHREKEPEAVSEVKQSHAEEKPEKAPKSGQTYAKEQPKETPVTDQRRAQDQPESKAAIAEPPAQKDPVNENAEPAEETSTPEQAPTADALVSSKAEQGTTADAAKGRKPNGTPKTPADGTHPHEDQQPKSASAEAAGAPEEVPEHSVSALAGAAASAAAGAAALATEDRDTLISSQPSVGTIESSQPAVTDSTSALTTQDSKPTLAGNSSGTNRTTEGLSEAGKPEAAPAKAPYDPLGMDTPDEAPGPGEVRLTLMTDVKQPQSFECLATSHWPTFLRHAVQGTLPLNIQRLLKMPATGLEVCCAMYARLYQARKLAQKLQRMPTHPGTTQSGMCSST